ncbi:MAG: hypothetical protein AAGF98_10280 [Cyanobacteria bacterium P01_H01_bin.153]
MSDKAKRQIILIGDLEIEGFQMPDGSYRMSQASAAKAVGLGRQNVSDFLRSKALKQLLGEGYTGQIVQVDIESDDQDRGQSRINALPVEAVNAYWHWQSYRGNRTALALCMALSAESIDRRFDAAFGISRSEAEYNQQLAARLQQTQQQLALLSDAYAEPDVLREKVSRLEEQLRQAGIEPWQIEGGDR